MISRSHPIGRRIRALRADRDLRDRDGVLIAEGPHLAAEALAAGATIEAAVVSPRLAARAEGRHLDARLRAAGVPVHDASDAVLDSLQDARSPQPVVLLVRRPRHSIDEVVKGRGAPMLLVLACGVQDPGNLGAILRVADGAGATGLLATPGGADLFHPRTVRASAGAIFRIPVAEAASASIHARVALAGGRLVGAAPRGGVSYDAFDWTLPLALALGGEGAGLPDDLESHLDGRVVVPMRPPMESLSVGAAAAVLLFEAARQRSTRGG